VNAASKVTYKVLSISTGVAGGLLAGAVGDAALRGLTFGLVHAAVDRATARGYHTVTHETPRRPWGAVIATRYGRM
jgi:hypothetical protein